MAGRKVFICVAAEDAGYYGELITALNAWEVPHTELGVVPGPITSMPPAIQNAIAECEVFLRVCTGNTKQSSAVNLATGYFQQLLNGDRQKRSRQRRRLVNLILDPAYPLDDEDKKTLYIMAPGKTRARWLDELAIPVGVATLAQHISRRAVLSMGVGAVLTLASAGVAGNVLVQEQQQKQQNLELPVRTKISGNPKFSFSLSDSKTYAHAQIIQDGTTIYAQPDLADSLDNPQNDSSVYVLSVSDRKQRKMPVTISSDVQGKLVAVANGAFVLYCSQPAVNPTLSSYRIVDARTGKQLWSQDHWGAAPPAIANGVFYAALDIVISRDADGITYEPSLNAYRMQDGALLWRQKDYGIEDLNTPAVVGNRLYIGSTDHNVYCLDTKTGKVVWHYLTRGPVISTPTVANSTVYIGSQDGNLYALDANSGALRWRFASSVGFRAAPLVLDGVVYAPSQDVYVYALDARTGAMFWRAYVGVDPNNDDLSIRSTDHNPVAVYRNVLFATLYGGLYAFDVRTGAQRWRYIPVEEDSGVISPPVMSGGLVLVGAADNHVYAVNP